MHPNVVLVAVVLVTAIRGFGPGVAWAFVGGLTANLLTRDPLGSIPLGLLVVAALVAGGRRLLGGLAWAYPIAAVAMGSLVVDAFSLGALHMVDAPVAGGLPVGRILAAALLNAVIAGIVVIPMRMLALRAGADETLAW